MRIYEFYKKLKLFQKIYDDSFKLFIKSLDDDNKSYPLVGCELNWHNGILMLNMFFHNEDANNVTKFLYKIEQYMNDYDCYDVMYDETEDVIDFEISYKDKIIYIITQTQCYK